MAGRVLEESPISTTLDLLGGKYRVHIIWALEADGLVHRNVVSDNPPWVEYSLTTTGQTLIPLLEAMSEWGALYQDMRREKARLSGSSRSPG